jgi:hypothetical protein
MRLLTTSAMRRRNHKTLWLTQSRFDAVGCFKTTGLTTHQS